jgi:hypothetical protein
VAFFAPNGVFAIEKKGISNVFTRAMSDASEAPVPLTFIQGRIPGVREEWQKEIASLLRTAEFRGITSRSSQLMYFRDPSHRFPYETLAHLFALPRTTTYDTIQHVKTATARADAIANSTQLFSGPAALLPNA